MLYEPDSTFGTVRFVHALGVVFGDLAQKGSTIFVLSADFGTGQNMNVNAPLNFLDVEVNLQ